MEQCIPEITDLLDKGLFTKTELNVVMKKRTNFEHRLNSRGSSTSDYIRYIEYENNVEKLRLKRLKRICQTVKTNSASDWSIQQRIIFIFQRGCNKFPKDIKLWAMYLDYLKGSSRVSYRKIQNVYNQILRLHPNNVDVWISCCKFEYEDHANFKSCRSVFQNGLRFNPDVPKLWYEYVKFELSFVSKLLNRRKVMNLINEREQEMDMLQEQEVANKENLSDREDDDHTTELKAPPSENQMKDKLNELPDVDLNMMGSDETNPALRGDIALEIYNVAMKKLGDSYISKRRGYSIGSSQENIELSRNALGYIFQQSMKFIKLFDEFSDLNRSYLINHIIQYLKKVQIDGVVIDSSLPDCYVPLLIQDILLNIRYMVLETLEIKELELSTKKYFAYKDKCPVDLVKKLASAYISYIQETFLFKMNKEKDSRYKILNAILKKL